MIAMPILEVTIHWNASVNLKSGDCKSLLYSTRIYEDFIWQKSCQCFMPYGKILHYLVVLSNNIEPADSPNLVKTSCSKVSEVEITSKHRPVSDHIDQLTAHDSIYVDMCPDISCCNGFIHSSTTDLTWFSMKDRYFSLTNQIAVFVTFERRIYHQSMIKNRPRGSVACWAGLLKCTALCTVYSRIHLYGHPCLCTWQCNSDQLWAFWTCSRAHLLCPPGKVDTDYIRKIIWKIIFVV